jgi:hypothetical protein
LVLAERLPATPGRTPLLQQLTRAAAETLGVHAWSRLDPLYTDEAIDSEASSFGQGLVAKHPTHLDSWLSGLSSARQRDIALNGVVASYVYETPDRARAEHYCSRIADVGIRTQLSREIERQFGKLGTIEASNGQYNGQRSEAQCPRVQGLYRVQSL